jgi:hypothetical protein
MVKISKHEYYDFTEHTETDPDGLLTVISTKTTWENVERQDECSVLIQGALSRNNFRLDFDFNLTSIDINGSINSQNVLYLLTIDTGTYTSAIELLITEIEDATDVFKLLFKNHNNDDSSYSDELDVNTIYYVTLERLRDEYTVTIYSDSGRTTEVTSMTINLADTSDARMILTDIYIAKGMDLNPIVTDATDRTDGYIENLDLNLECNTDFVIDSNSDEFIKTSEPNWVNTQPEIQSDIWSKSPFMVSYTLRVQNLHKWILEQLLISGDTVTLIDTVRSINDTYWLSLLEVEWDGDFNWDYPWRIEVELIHIA